MVSSATACHNKLKLLRIRMQKHTSTHKPQKHMLGQSITDNSSFCNSSKTSTGNMLRPTITTTTSSSTMAATAPLPLTSASKIKRCVYAVHREPMFEGSVSDWGLPQEREGPLGTCFRFGNFLLLFAKP